MDQNFIEEAEQRYAPPGFPVRILWGENDAWIPLGQGRELAGKLTKGERTTLPRAGHLVQEDAPEAIVAALLDTD